MSASSPGWSRRASTPPCTRGCSVFTRPPSISGLSVSVSTGTTSRPAARSAFAVPPDATSSTPSSDKRARELDEPASCPKRKAARAAPGAPESGGSSGGTSSAPTGPVQGGRAQFLPRRAEAVGGTREVYRVGVRVKLHENVVSSVIAT